MLKTGIEKGKKMKMEGERIEHFWPEYLPLRLRDGTKKSARLRQIRWRSYYISFRDSSSSPAYPVRCIFQDIQKWFVPPFDLYSGISGVLKMFRTRGRSIQKCFAPDSGHG